MAKNLSATETAVVETSAAETVEAPKMVKIKLFKDSDKYKGALFVGVNGRTWLIQRGVEVEVPDYVAEVINNSLEEDRKTSEKISEEEAKYDEKTRNL